ncbi:MAG: ERF family protein [Candidatus Gallimonas sp.]
MSVYEKLQAIQQELKAPKTQYNPAFRGHYRSCEDITEAAKPICARYKTALTMSDKIVMLGTRYYIESTATLYDCESAEKVSVTGYAREEETKKGMDGSQITGASSSYARKYALGGLFALDDNQDSDATNTGTEPARKPAEGAQKSKEPPKSGETRKKLKELGATDKFLAWAEGKVGKPVEQFTVEEVTELAGLIRKKKEESKQAARQAYEEAEGELPF